MRRAPVILLPAACLLTASCASVQHGSWETFRPVETERAAPPAADWEDAAEAALETPPAARSGEVTRRRIPASGVSTVPGTSDALPALRGAPISVTIPAQPVPRFINVVFGEILDQPFILGPGVAEMSEMVSLRTVQEMDRTVFLDMVSDALRNYGLAVQYREGRFTITTQAELRSQAPQFIMSRARQAAPSSMRPVIQFVELHAIDAADLQQILQQALPDREAISVGTNRAHNYLILSGLPSDVDAALAIINQMDRPRFAGTDVIQFQPRNWRVRELSSTLESVIATEGRMIQQAGGLGSRNITLLPIPFTNQLLIFARTRAAAEYALTVAQDLDRAAARSEARRAHVYEAQYSEAARLAEILGSVLQIESSGASSQNTGGEGEGRSSPQQARSSGSASGSGESSRLTVDEVGNRLIFFGTQPEFEQIVSLMEQIDTPEREVLIEVTIAEVTLTDEWDMGLEAVFDSEAASRFLAEINSGGGLSGTIQSGQVTLTGSVGSSNNQIHILSTPRVTVRSGSEATFQVGTDVPIITSQRAAPTQAGGSTDVLQSVQYRSTGIILSIRPRVYSNNRIDLEINQEVSSAEPNDTANISSPLISNRSLTSELSLQDGYTAVLGGLIENRFTRGRSGVPFLKDIPVLGAPFRADRLSAGRTMLVVFVTPYVMHDRDQRQAIVDNFVDILNRSFEEQLADRPTLRTPGQPFRIRPRGEDTQDGSGTGPASR